MFRGLRKKNHEQRINELLFCKPVPSSYTSIKISYKNITISFNFWRMIGKNRKESDKNS